MSNHRTLRARSGIFPVGWARLSELRVSQRTRLVASGLSNVKILKGVHSGLLRIKHKEARN